MMDPFISKTRSYSIGKTLLLTLVVFLLGFFFLNTPVARQIGLSARYDLVLPVFILFVSSIILFSIPGLVGDILVSIFLTLVFSLTVSGLWASGTSEQYVMAGWIPASDSMLYYIDSLRFLEGGFVSSISADKPFITSLISGLLGITGFNWQNSMIIILVLVILAVYFAVRQLQQTHGPAAASVFLIITFLFYRHFSGTAMAENLGVPLGMLSYSMLWAYCEKKQERWLIAGMFMLTLALFARLGALLTPVILLIWIIGQGIYSKKTGFFSWKTWKNPLIIIGLILLVVGISRFVTILIAGPDVISSTQLARHLYSLVTGGRYWGSLEAEHPELNTLSSNSFTIEALRICFDYFLQNPFGLLQGLANNYSTYFTDSIRGEYSYIDGAGETITLVFRLGCFILAGIGLFSLYLKRNRPFSLLVLFSFIGLFISIPFVPPISTFKLRLMASTIWIQALLPALAIEWIFSFLPTRFTQWWKNFSYHSPINPTPSLILGLSILFFMVLSPWIIRSTAHPTALPALTCAANEKKVVMRAEPGSYAVLVDHYDTRQGWIPFIRIAYFQLRIHNLPHNSQFPIFEKINRPTVLIQGLDLLTSLEILVFAPAEMYSQKPGLVLACGNFLENPPIYTEDFFFANSLTELNNP